MNDNTINKNEKYKRFPLSKNERQCLSPCYFPNTKIHHPVYYNLVSDDEPFCASEMYTDKDGIDKLTDGCNNPTRNAPPNEDVRAITTTMFTKKYFLLYYYDIETMNDSLIWLEKNTHVPLNTKIRIIYCALYEFGKNIDIIDDRLTNFFISFIKSKHINKIYDNIHNNIGIDGENILIVASSNLPQNNFKIERINYTINTFITTDTIKRFIQKYIELKKTKWNNINNHLEEMANDLLVYITSKIKYIIDNDSQKKS